MLVPLSFGDKYFLVRMYILYVTGGQTICGRVLFSRERFVLEEPRNEISVRGYAK
jgi:hypothetical protein